jgi:HD-like signal output (HDOD) protein
MTSQARYMRMGLSGHTPRTMSSPKTSAPMQLDIPAMPAALVRLSRLLQAEEVDLKALASLVESDMALAAAVMKAVSSAITGVRGRVNSVQQAVTFLGIREVAAITYEVSMRAAFPPIVELDLVWKRGARRGTLMKFLAQKMRLEPYAAHAAGLFEECGKAVLFRHAPDHYRSMLRAAPADMDLVILERAGFGLGHDELGARMCEAWMLSPEAVCSVRHHLEVRRSGQLPAPPEPRELSVVSAIVWAIMTEPGKLGEAVQLYAPQIGRDPEAVMDAAEIAIERADEAGAGG